MNKPSLNLDKLVLSDINYHRMIKEELEKICFHKDVDSILKQVVNFCKHNISVNIPYKKKILCLALIKDLSQKIRSSAFEKILDENIPMKLLKTVTSELNLQAENKVKQIDAENSEKLILYGIQTINFWSKKLSFVEQHPQFGQVLQELKKMKVEIPKSFQLYNPQLISANVMFGNQKQESQEIEKNQDASPVIIDLFEKFAQCKVIIEEKVNQAVIKDEEVFLRNIHEKLRDFLLHFFSKYKQLESETSLDRDVLIVYFHILNNLFKKICSKFFMPSNQFIKMSKGVFEENHSTEFNSIDRMDIVNLAGIHKYNVLSVFQRIHQRIQQQQLKMPSCILSLEQKEFRENFQSSLPKREKFTEQQDNKSVKFRR